MSFLSDGITMVRGYSDEPSDSAKFSDSWIVSQLGIGATRIQEELARTHHLKFYQEASLNLVADQEYYWLPGNFLKFINWVEKYNEYTKGAVALQNEPEKYGFFLVDGRRARVHPLPDNAATLYFRYQRKGIKALLEGTGTADSTAGTLSMDSVTYGTMNYTSNYYVGSYVRVWDSDNQMDFNISSQDGTTLTLDQTIPSGLNGASKNFCILPDIPDDCWDVAYWWVVRQMKAIDKDADGLAIATQMYKESRYALLQQFTAQEGRHGSRIVEAWPAGWDMAGTWEM